jgi:hypothetical protein
MPLEISSQLLHHLPSGLRVGFLLLASTASHAAILDVPVLQPAPPNPLERPKEREILLRDADLHLSLSPGGGRQPEAKVDYRHFLSDTASVTYGSQVGLDGLPVDVQAEQRDPLALRLRFHQRFAVEWRTPRISLGNRISFDTEDRIGWADRDLDRTLRGNYLGSFSNRTGRYALRYSETARAQEGALLGSERTVGLGWTRDLSEIPLRLELQPSVSFDAPNGDGLFVSRSPSLEGAVVYSLDPETRLRFGVRGEQENTRQGVLQERRGQVFSRMDWNVTGAARLVLETQAGLHSTYNEVTGRSESSDFELRASPRVPIGKGFDARMDLILGADRDGERPWEPAKRSVFFSIGGSW